jgi:hypothetical protein
MAGFGRLQWTRSLGVAAGAMMLGCTVSSGPGAVYDFFHPPREGDPWSRKIAAWQSRVQAEVPRARDAGPASVSGPGGSPADAQRSAEPTLEAKFTSFRAQQRRLLARSLAGWIQEQAKDHYVPDGPFDHWATLQETLERDGDDCDGLELIPYHFLREHGFGEDEVFRAIVHRPEDGQHHMVTLWFEDAEDPWIIDPTGAMTSGMPRLSQVPGWVPLKLFTESREYSPLLRPRHDPTAVSAR